MKQFFTFLLVAVFGASCSSDNEPTPINQQNIPVENLLIGKDNLYGNGQEQIMPGNMVINNQQQWEELQTKMNAVNPCTSNFVETDVDFNTWTILAVFDEIRPNGGNSIDITNVVMNADQIIVTVENVLTGNGTTVMTQPFHVVKIPATTAAIVFE